VWDKAVTYCRQAGTRALARSAYREAVVAFEHALRALDHLPECRDTLAQAIDLRFDLRTALRPLDEQARIFAHLCAAEALAERLGDAQRLGRIAGYLCVYFAVLGEHARALAAGQRALVLATSSGAFDVQVIAQTYLSQAYHAVGNFRQTLEVARQTMGLLTGEQRLRHFGLIILPAMTARGYVAWCLAERGDFPEGCGVGADAVRLAEAAAHPLSLAAALMFVGVLYGRQGHVHQAIPRLERALGLSQTINLPIFFPLTAASLGAAYARAGRAAEALPLLDQTMERVATGRRVLFHELVLTELSEALLLVGRVDEARVLASDLCELVRTHTGGGHQAYALRLLGEIAAQREPAEVTQATAHYRQALALAEELGMRPLQAHCHRGLGLLYTMTCQREQAHSELSTAFELYRTMEMTFWLLQTEAALAQVEGR